MDQKFRADQIPARAHRLYVQLYCERKGEKNKKTIIEAKKSWVSLSLSKKKLFYKTTASRNLLNYAHGLSNTKIYLKDKIPKLKQLCQPQDKDEHGRELQQRETIASINESYGLQLQEGNEVFNNNTLNETKLEDADATKVVNIESSDTQGNLGTRSGELSSLNCGNDTKFEEADETQEVNIQNSFCDPSSPNQVDEIEDALETQSTTSSIQRPAIPLAEPTPPTVKIGKDLYEMMKQPGNAEWKAVSVKDRSFYNSAVRIIKREYIKNYTKYLESLSQQHLFDHYIKTLC